MNTYKKLIVKNIYIVLLILLSRNITIYSAARIRLEENIDIDRQLIDSITKGDRASVERLIKLGSNVNSLIEGFPTPLFQAVFMGHTDIAKLLIDAKADINIQDGGGHTALTLAVDRGNMDIVELLIKAGADVNLLHLDWADFGLEEKINRRKYSEIAKLLIKAGANVNLPDEDYENEEAYCITPLMYTIRNGNIDAVRLLIENGAEVNAQTDEEIDTEGNQQTALIEAIYTECCYYYYYGLDSSSEHSSEFFEILEEQDENVYQENKGLVKLLLDSGADLNFVDSSGKRAIEHAKKIVANLNREINNEKLFTIYSPKVQNHYKETKKIAENLIQLLRNEPKRRKDAHQRRLKITEYLKNATILPTVLTDLINDYLPTDLKSTLSDYTKAEKIAGPKLIVSSESKEASDEKEDTADNKLKRKREEGTEVNKKAKIVTATPLSESAIEASISQLKDKKEKIIEEIRKVSGSFDRVKDGDTEFASSGLLHIPIEEIQDQVDPYIEKKCEEMEEIDDQIKELEKMRQSDN